MRDWILFFLLYGLVIGLFRVLGGFGAAADAFRRWGKASSSIRENPTSS
jgi:hypothetical protein